MSRFVMAGDVPVGSYDWGVLGRGDSVYIDKDVVHGSDNDFDEPAQLAVVLAPAVGDGGYVAIDVSAEEPWASAR